MPRPSRPCAAGSTVAARLAWSLAAIAAPLACATSRAVGGPLDPRFVAVHNTLSAMGLAQVGPIQEGTLAEGREARASLALPAGCVTIVAIGGAGVRDLDATLLDPRGTPLAHDTTSEPQAVLHPCVDAADSYTLVVKATAGAGSWLAATWAGGSSATPASSASVAAAPTEANGTCRAPIPLEPGVVSGSTTHGEHENAGSCGPSDSRELVYELDVSQRERVTIEVEARFDSVLYVRKEDCTDASAEVDCSDDAPDRAHSRVEHVLEPGRYFVFVDGYGHESGSFKMTVTATEVLALSDACRRAPLLVDGVSQSGTTANLADDAHATCGAGAQGANAVWQAEVASRSRVRITERSADMAPVLHVRRACGDEQSEVACSESGAAAGEATVTGVLDAGRYAVFADAHDREATGRYSIFYETAPPAGDGAPSDGCGDATHLPGGESGTFAGDTFAARDDVSSACGGAGAPDVVYRVDVPWRARFDAWLDGEEALHSLALWRRCGDPSTETACGRSLDAVVAPGTYYVGVDGLTPGSFGRFTLGWRMHDLASQASVCAQPRELLEGHAVDGTTLGAPDDFDASCAPAGDRGGTGPDRVFRFVVDRRKAIRLTLSAKFDAALSVRRACADAPGSALQEIACEIAANGGNRATVIDRTFDPGTYWAVVDGATPKDEGAFSLEYRAVK